MENRDAYIYGVFLFPCYLKLKSNDAHALFSINKMRWPGIICAISASGTGSRIY